MDHSCNQCGTSSNAAEAVTETEAPDTGPQAALARFRFAADAGYFADELQGQFSIPATVRLEENYEATTGQQLVAFVLSVPVDTADEAVPKLKQLIEAAQGGEYDALPGGLDGPVAQVAPEADSDEAAFSAAQPQSRSGIHVPSWMFLLLVCVGTAALIVTQRQQAPADAPAEAAAPELTDEQVFLRELLAASPEPWGRETLDGGRQEISLDRSTGTMRLREDADGDGSFEIDRRLTLDVR